MGRSSRRCPASVSRAGIVRRNIVGETGRPVKALWYRALPSGSRGADAFLRRLVLSSMAASPTQSKPSARSRATAPAAAGDGVPRYTISELAQEFALTTRAIRFYEDEGLIAPERKGRARIYGDRERVRIKLILRGKRLGLALSEIRELFDLYATTRSERPQLVKFLQILADRRAMLHQQREDIDAVLAEIAVIERDCRKRLKTGDAPGLPPARHTADD